MGEPLIPGLLGEQVNERTIHSARPARGRTGATISQQIAALLACRGLRGTFKDWEMSQVTDDSVGAASLRTDWYIPVHLSPFGSQLWVGLWLFAEEGGSAPSMTVSLEDTAAGVIDAGFTASQANGYLPTSPQLLAGLLEFGAPGLGPFDPVGVTGGRDRFWHPPHVEGSGATPRLLDASTYEGQLVMVRIQTTGVRLYGGTVVEAYRSRVG